MSIVGTWGFGIEGYGAVMHSERDGERVLRVNGVKQDCPTVGLREVERKENKYALGPGSWGL